MQTWHIHIEGQIQGVGFRPFIYRLALEQNLAGWVNNATDGVHIEINGKKEEADSFVQNILLQAPALSRITHYHIHPIPHKHFTGFSIIQSLAKNKINLLLTPDFALCPDCRKDLSEPGNRRIAYPFTTCTYCGPRYSIIRQLPYDRIGTSMDPFTMCSTCKIEYTDPLNRRYYAQTNSCPDCSIPIQLFDNEQVLLSESMYDIITLILQAWNSGKIVAIKGVGGYLLTCSAQQASAVELLRSRKNRPSKPFALMYPNASLLAKDVQLEEKELKALQSHVAPIVLLTPKPHADFPIEIAPGLGQLGVMLPYAPIFEILLEKYQRPIIATSGNPTGSPIVFDDQKALTTLTSLADLILINKREIVVPQDDSLIRHSPFLKKRILLRRSRGLAPTFIDADLERPDNTLVAMGAMLKSTFTFLHQQNIYVSQYLGDLANFDTEESYRHTIRHFFHLFETEPDIILADKHPNYPSTFFARQLAGEFNIPLELVQHHQAHFGAILGEHKLLQSSEPILGVIWDGTGMGDDGHIWGGEFFTYQDFSFQRSFHFDYFDFILGDKMPKEPRISALSACWNIPEMEEQLQGKFTKIEWQVYTQLLNKSGNLLTSSLGRIFDAMASLLGLSDKQTYEGEAAMKLEELAIGYFKEHGLDFSSTYFVDPVNQSGSTKQLMKAVLLDLKKGEKKEYIAAKFHFSLVHLISILARQLNIQKIAFSGGVFQNGLLLDLINHHLDSDYQLFFHQRLSPNDENVSFGQMICHQIKQHKK